MLGLHIIYAISLYIVVSNTSDQAHLIELKIAIYNGKTATLGTSEEINLRVA